MSGVNSQKYILVRQYLRLRVAPGPTSPAILINIKKLIYIQEKKKLFLKRKFEEKWENGRERERVGQWGVWREASRWGPWNGGGGGIMVKL